MEDKNEKKERSSSKLKYSISIILIVVGILLLSSNQISGYIYENWLNEKQETIISNMSKEKIEENIVSLELEEKNVEDMFNYESITNIEGFNPPKVDISKLDNAIGVITIPSVNLEQPILYGTTNQNLLLGATTMKPDQKMGEGNYTLAGHNHHSRPILFQPIRNVEEGEKIFVTDKKKVYAYKVTKKEIVDPHRIDVLDDIEGKNTITLVSCYEKDGSNRIIVSGELYEVKDYQE